MCSWKIYSNVFHAYRWKTVREQQAGWGPQLGGQPLNVRVFRCTLTLHWSENAWIIVLHPTAHCRRASTLIVYPKETDQSNNGPGNHVPLKIVKGTLHIYTGADSGDTALSSDVYREIGLSCKRGNRLFQYGCPQVWKLLETEVNSGENKFQNRLH